jgi:hypothetical protein
VNEIRLKSIFQLSSHMKSAKFMARGLVTERIFSLVLTLRVNSLPLALIYEVKIPLRKWKISLLQRNPAQMTWHNVAHVCKRICCFKPSLISCQRNETLCTV